ncbi:MAG TPA: multidrug efflux RND transporter permease subunit [Terrimicrobiaceae bacterium]
MNFSKIFIDRPIFAAVLSILIVLIGSIAYQSLPVAQYPEVAPPTIAVRASYPGASPQVIAETVATPIEQEVNGVEDMLYMSSQSTNDGVMTLTITFKLGTDLDKAQVLVQNRVAIAEPRLPEDVRRVGVTTLKRSPDLLLVVHMVSPDDTYDQLYISNFATLQVREQLKRVEGVGDVNVFGAREYSMRVWLDASRLTYQNLTTTEILTALRNQNVQVAAGVIGQPPLDSDRAFQVNVIAQGRLSMPEEFEKIIVKTGEDGRVVSLGDVARVELGAQDYLVNSYLDGKPAVAMAIQQLPGSNALATAERVRERMRELSHDFPKGIEYRVVYDPTVFIDESVKAVIHTIFEAALLVVVVVMAFLQSWRASIIPILAIPVSLIGTFAVMAALGFSLNNLSLFGLVLAIGIVVDDAIVVVENVERNLSEGLAPREATIKTMEEVGGALVAIALVLSAVFIPTAFISGISGQFYRQFALTIAVATLFSCFVSLTLSPALCRVLLQPHGAKRDWFARVWDFLLGWFFRLFNRGFAAGSERYGRLISVVTRRTVIVLILYVGLLVLTAFGFLKIPAGFIPSQDQGYFIIVAQLPEGASLSRTDKVVRKITDLVREIEGVVGVVAFAGFDAPTGTNAPNKAAVFTPLAPFDERVEKGLSGQKILTALREKLGTIDEALVLVFPPPPVRGMGNVGGFRMMVEDRRGRGFQALQRAAGEVMAESAKRPELIGVFSGFRADAPQFYADIDRTKAQMLNVPIENVFATLQTQLGSAYVNDLNLFGRTFRVIAQADSAFREDPEDVGTLRTRSATGASVPLGTILSIESRTGPSRVERYNLYPAAAIDGDTARGFSSGQGLSAMEEIANQVLPDGFGFEWTGLAYQQILAGNTALFIFPLCVLFVFLILAALYESWSLPLSIILVVPMCVLAALAGVWLRGMDNNILTQIGFVVLVGLACKNAILIVEFAKEREDKGSDRFEAVIEASKLRLRPILMTSFAFILGVLPLVLASGAGSEMRQSLGTAVFFGMLGVTFFGLVLTPVFYVAIRRFASGKKPPSVQVSPELVSH